MAATAPRLDPGCHLTKRTEMPMELVQNHYVVTALLNGRPATMMVDTGAMGSGLLFSAIESLGLAHDVDRSIVVSGVGGQTEVQHPALVHSLKLGGVNFADVPTPGLKMLAMDASAGPVGLIGADMLSHYDVEFDFPKGVMALWSADGCKRLVPPWQGRMASFHANRIRGNAFVIPVALNGHVVRALLDTGSDATQVSREAALASGVTQEALEADKAGTRYGVSGKAMKSHLHHFDTVRIGPETFRGGGMIVTDGLQSEDIDMLLGSDFMRRRRIWVSYTTGEVFIQPPPPANPPAAMALPGTTPHIASEPVVPTAPGNTMIAATPAPPNQRAMPIATPASRSGPESYPAAALRMGEQGVVGYELTIDPTGHATACSVTQSSGSASLDAATCSRMMHGSFRPATDATGKPTSGVHTGSIRWTIPQTSQMAVGPRQSRPRHDAPGMTGPLTPAAGPGIFARRRQGTPARRPR
jgi:TonB family protein